MDKYAVLGHPIGHSLSPIMHTASFKSLGLDATYEALDVAPDVLIETLPRLRDDGFRGLNLTVPLKEVAYKGLGADNLDPAAAAQGAGDVQQRCPSGRRATV